MFVESGCGSHPNHLSPQDGGSHLSHQDGGSHPRHQDVIDLTLAIRTWWNVLFIFPENGKDILYTVLVVIKTVSVLIPE